MKHDLRELKLTANELESLTGFEVNEIFIGGVLGGVYRPVVFRSLKRFTSFCITELLIFVVTFIFTLPFGLSIIRSSTKEISEVSAIIQFLGITLGVTFLVFVSWNIYMKLKAKSLKTLAHLLDEVDKYNEVIQAVDILDKLEAIGNVQAIVINREQVIKALNIARDSLVCGLRTEKVLRENHNFLARRHQLFADIENNLATLRTLEVNNQASEYAELLNEALQIGTSVHQEMQKISHYW